MASKSAVSLEYNSEKHSGDPKDGRLAVRMASESAAKKDCMWAALRVSKKADSKVVGSVGSSAASWAWKRVAPSADLWASCLAEQTVECSDVLLVDHLVDS